MCVFISSKVSVFLWTHFLRCHKLDSKSAVWCVPTTQIFMISHLVRHRATCSNLMASSIHMPSASCVPILPTRSILAPYDLCRKCCLVCKDHCLHTYRRYDKRGSSCAWRWRQRAAWPAYRLDRGGSAWDPVLVIWLEEFRGLHPAAGGLSVVWHELRCSLVSCNYRPSAPGLSCEFDGVSPLYTRIHFAVLSDRVVLRSLALIWSGRDVCSHRTTHYFKPYPDCLHSVWCCLTILAMDSIFMLHVSYQYIYIHNGDADLSFRLRRSPLAWICCSVLSRWGSYVPNLRVSVSASVYHGKYSSFGIELLALVNMWKISWLSVS